VATRVQQADIGKHASDVCSTGQHVACVVIYASSVIGRLVVQHRIM
jgi:hypothetical protein